MSKKIVITGGASGIGLAIAELALKQGHTPIVFDIFNKNNNKNNKIINKNIEYKQVDVSCSQSVQDAFEQIDRVDVLVNNAGIVRDNLVLRMSELDWDSVLDVNLKGAFLCAQRALRFMIRQKKGYIINISSVVGIYGNVGQANYAASKAGLIALTKTLAKEYAGKNVLVNAIAPGFIQTSMTSGISEELKNLAKSQIALKRFGTVEDVANLVGFLISGAADYITGQVFSVDGGMF